MAPKKDSRAGNTQELDKLEKEIAQLNVVQGKILAEKKKISDENIELTKKVTALNKSLEIAYDKIKKYEAPAQTLGSGESATMGYVEIGIIPINGTIYPPSSKIDGIIVPRSIDENKVAHESLPIDNAIRIMSDGSGYKRALLGPVDKIEGVCIRGVHTKNVVFNRHKISKNAAGDVCFIEVTVEEPKEKAE
jgi:hypothetical protein